MGLISKNPNASLTAQLANKESSLVAAQESEAEASRSFSDLAASAANNSRIAQEQAAAVGQALKILSDAGVA